MPNSDPTVAGDQPQPISLLLSGGGFRATLFHLGTIRYLRETKRLGDVKEVFSVSGGSILAGHLAVRWSDYVGDESQFAAAADEIIKFTRSGLRESIVRKWLLCYAIGILLLVVTSTLFWNWFGLASLQTWLLLLGVLAVEGFLLRTISKWFLPIRFLESSYRKLYGKATLKKLHDSPVAFNFLATNLTTGSIACFTKSGLYHDLQESAEAPEHIPTTSIRISQCVAASSAFPPMFSPLPIDPVVLKLDQAKLSTPQYLSDGGVFDNLGLRAKRILSGASRLTIVSDAERRFDWSTDSDFRGLVERTTRATDILMNRVNRLEFEIISHRGALNSETQVAVLSDTVKFVRLQEDFPATDGEHLELDPDLKRRCRRIRTDLDAFTPCEIQVLFCAGYIAAKHAFEGAANLGPGVLAASNGMPANYQAGRWLPFNSEKTLGVEDLLGHFEHSESPRYKLIDLRSGICWGLLLVAMAILCFNPVSINVWQQWPAKPKALIGKTLVSFTTPNLPPSLSMLINFIPSVQQNSASYLVETADLSAHTLFRMPASFRCSLTPPDRCTLLSQIWFLRYPDRDSVTPLHTDEGSSTTYLVHPLARNARLVLLVEVETENGQDIKLGPTDFKFEVN